jgi:hypothetical protein
MTPAEYCDLLRELLDEMTTEYPVPQDSWLVYEELTEAIDKFEHEMNRVDFLKETS